MKERTNVWMKRSAVILAFIVALMVGMAGCQKGAENAADNTMENTAEGSATKASMTITCAGVLDEMDKVAANKKQYIPQDGIILVKENVEIQDGETVFAFLQKLCKENDIQMSYAEGLVYVTSIGNLNEKDCGAESGWMYKVNGESPSVGVEQYTLKDGDKVEFYYITSYAEAL